LPTRELVHVSTTARPPIRLGLVGTASDLVRAIEALAHLPAVEVAALSEPTGDPSAADLARDLKLPLLQTPMDVFRTEANVVLELTGDSRQYERLLAVKPSRVEVISTRGARLMLEVLQQARNLAGDPVVREVVKEVVREVPVEVIREVVREVESTTEIVPPKRSEGYGDLRGLVDGVRKAAAEWEAFLGVAEATAREREHLRARCAELERGHEEIRTTHEGLLREYHGTVEALGEIRAEQRARCEEHEATARALRELRDECQALGRARQNTAEELEAVLRRLRG